MVKIVIENFGKKELTINDLSKTVLHHLHTHFIDWMHDCGGTGRCTSCKMKILSGMKSISEKTPAEKSFEESGDLKPDERLACQARISGSIRINVPEEFKLPHVNYSS